MYGVLAQASAVDTGGVFGFGDGTAVPEVG
jgi:hypothetical protein